MQLTGGATVTATISVGLATNVFAVRPPVSIVKVGKEVRDFPFWLKIETSYP